MTVGNPIGPCSVGHGFEVTVRPMAKTKGDRVGDALCFHLASFDRVACKARASDLLRVTPVGPRPHPSLSPLRTRREKNEGRQDRRCSEERHHRICDERVRERGLPVCKLKQSRSILISQICDVTNCKRLRSPESSSRARSSTAVPDSLSVNSSTQNPKTTPIQYELCMYISESWRKATFPV